jgi:tetratricopeptide (TPR) repeat protein
VIPGSKEETMGTRSEKPDFIADEYGRVWEARYAPSVQGPATRRPKTSGRQVYLIPIPIGLLISLVAFLFSSLSNDGSQRAAARLNEANAAFDRGRFEEAIALYGEAIAKDPNLPVAYFNRGLAYSANSDYKRAIADFDRALDLSPDLARAYFSRGLAYYALDKTDKAIADFDQAIERTPESVSECWEEAAKHPDGHWIGGCAIGSSAIELPEAYAYRGIAYLAKGYDNRGLTDLDRAIALQPDLAIAYYARGVARLAMGDYDLGIADLEAVLRLDNDPDASRKAQSLLAELGVSPAVETPGAERS